MNEQQLAAVKQALEALKDAASLIEYECYSNALQEEAITALQSIISQDALDKKADNARELGLSYEPVQEPVAWGIVASNTGRICQVELDAAEVEGHNPKHIVPLYTTPQPVPVKTYHDGKPWPVAPVPNGPYSAPIKELWPVAPKPWVGLTDDERLEVAEIDGADEWFWKVCKAIEAKLKEKNT